MHIASLVVRTRPEDCPSVVSALDALAGVELHAVTPDGRLVVTIEADNRGACSERLLAINAIPRVLSAGLVYEQSEDEITETTP
jgi:nitrate reductase NapD